QEGKLHACHAYCRNQLGQHETALPDYQAAVAAGVATPELFNNLGYCLLKMSRLQEAREHFDRAIARDPHLSFPYRHRAALALSETLRWRAQAERSLDAARVRDMLQIVFQPLPQLGAGVSDIEKAFALGYASAEAHRDAGPGSSRPGAGPRHPPDRSNKQSLSSPPAQ